MNVIIICNCNKITKTIY